MLEDGLLDGVGSPTGAFALHVTHRQAPGVVATRPGPTMASGDTIQIVVHGRGGHASAPHDCLDPIPIACEMVQALQTGPALPNHSNRMLVNESALATGIAMHVAVALRFFERRS